MQWTITDEGEYVLITIVGRFNHPPHERLVADLASRPFWRPGRRILYDNRNLDLDGAKLETMARAADIHVDMKESFGNSRTAVLMGSPASFGVGRQFEALVDQRMDTVVRIFLDEDEAVDWLAERGSRGG